MKKVILIPVLAAIALLGVATAPSAAQTWDAFVIRNASTSGDAPTISDSGAGKLFGVTQGGQKVGGVLTTSTAVR